MSEEHTPQACEHHQANVTEWGCPGCLFDKLLTRDGQISEGQANYDNLWKLYGEVKEQLSGSNALMTTKRRHDTCTTHYDPCPCKQYRAEQMEGALKIIQAWAISAAEDAASDEEWRYSMEDEFKRIANQAAKGLGREDVVVP